MLSALWIIFLICALASDLISGAPYCVGTAALAGAARGAEIALSISGALCLWSGVNRVMEQAGLLSRLAALLRPVLGRLFPVSACDETCFSLLCGNLSANLLGLGNAATPLGIRTVQRMQQHSGSAGISDELCLFIVLNTASLQLIPSTAAAVRAGLGAVNAFDILPAVWLSSACSVLAGVLAARFFAAVTRR